MKENEFGLTSIGRIKSTSFDKIKELIVPYFKDAGKIVFHDDGDNNVTLENNNWSIYIHVSDILINNLEEDYLIDIGYKKSFGEGEKALKDFADYLFAHDFIYALEYEDAGENQYLIEHPGWSALFEHRKKKTNIYKNTSEEDRHQRSKDHIAKEISPFYDGISNWLKKLFT